MRVQVAPSRPPCLRYFASYAETIVQDPDPPAAALEAALVHAAVPPATRTPRLLVAESPQRHARVRGRAVHLFRAAAGAHLRRHCGSAAVPPEHTRCGRRHVPRQPAHHGADVHRRVLGRLSSARHRLPRHRVRAELAVADDGADSDLETVPARLPDPRQHRGDRRLRRARRHVAPEPGAEISQAQGRQRA